MGNSLLERDFISALNDNGTATASSSGTTVTSSASLNTKGAYSQLTAATTQDADYIILGPDNRLTAGNGFMDFAVGGAGSEQIVVADLFVSNNSTNLGIMAFLPLKIPAGTRLAARWQSTSSSDALRLNAVLGAGNFSFKSFSKVDTYGFVAASSFGTSIDPGGTINTKGAYSQLTAATARDHFGLMFAIDNLDDFTLTSSSLLMDIAIGAAAAEQVIIPNLQILMQSGGQVNPMLSGVIPVQIPAGTRLAVRAQSTANAAGARAFGCTLYGFS